jgi:hypothetical protein
LLCLPAPFGLPSAKSLSSYVLVPVSYRVGTPDFLNLPNTFAGYIPAVPMIALAVAEFGRVPLASVIFQKHKLIQGVAIGGIVALGYLAAENWMFGFERIVDLRLKAVNAARTALASRGKPLCDGGKAAE